MSNSSRPPVTGRDVSGAGALMLAVSLLMGSGIVAERFHDV